jgi:hypothetical protein
MFEPHAWLIRVEGSWGCSEVGPDSRKRNAAPPVVQGPLDLTYEGFHGMFDLNLRWMRILLWHPVAVSAASERPNGRVQQQCEHTVPVCFYCTGKDRHTQCVHRVRRRVEAGSGFKRAGRLNYRFRVDLMLS